MSTVNHLGVTLGHDSRQTRPLGRWPVVSARTGESLGAGPRVADTGRTMTSPTSSSQGTPDPDPSDLSSDSSQGSSLDLSPNLSQGSSPSTLDRLISVPATRAERVTHVRTVPAREARYAEWPEWADAEVVRRFAEAGGIRRPWLHQVEAADAAWAGRHVTLATGTASGKSLGFLLPSLTAVREGVGTAATLHGGGGTTLYLAPTKALAADQLRRLTQLAVPGVRAGLLDGDTDVDARDWVRRHADYVLSNPDMLHYSLLPGHARWASFLRRLRYVVVDECHTYKGIFGSHVAM